MALAGWEYWTETGRRTPPPARPIADHAEQLDIADAIDEQDVECAEVVDHDDADPATWDRPVFVHDVAPAEDPALVAADRAASFRCGWCSFPGERVEYRVIEQYEDFARVRYACNRHGLVARRDVARNSIREVA